MKKKIKELTLKEFYLFLTKQMEEIKLYCSGIEPIDCLKEITVAEYLETYGHRKVNI